MPRIKLRAQDSYSFSTRIRVRITDLNYGAHLANDRLLALIHEARVAYFESFGMSEFDFAGASLILTDSAVVYRGEAFGGDILNFEVSAGEAARMGFRLFYRVTRESDSQLIALVETGMACFDYDKKRTIRIPEEAKKRLFQVKIGGE